MTPRRFDEPRRRAVSAIALLLALFVFACTPKNSARGVVDRFIEAHYISIDLPATEPLCTGLALDKIHQEMKLTQGQSIDASTRKPVIHYKLQHQRDDRDHITFLFKARIDVPEGGSFNKFWMITARKDGETWKISNYSEYD
jgi:hypothetical protein